MATWIALKSLKKVFLAKINFVDHLLAMKLVINIMKILLTFGTIKMKNMEDCGSHYFYTSCYSWNSMLGLTGASLKLISGIEKYQFIEIMIRGDISRIYKGYSKNYNNFLKSYNLSKPSTLQILRC